MSLELVKVQNIINHPEGNTDTDTSIAGAGTGSGPVIKEIAKRAYDLGADYFYRVGDDSEFQGRWAHMFVETLSDLNMNPPDRDSSTAAVAAAPILLGVVGPSAVSAPHEKMLAHDFVHRTHMEIFQMTYYPEDVSENEHLMSTWMSSVYGFERTFKITKTKVSINNNHFNSEGTAMSNMVVRSQRVISDWLKSHRLPSGIFGTVGEGQPSTSKNVFQVINKLSKYPNLVVECDAGAGSLSARAQYCAKTRKKHGVIPRKSKGSLSKAELAIWKENECGDMFHPWYNYDVATIPKKGKSNKRSSKKGTATSFHKLPMPDCLEQHAQTPANSSSFPLIAILSGSTSRKEAHPSNTTLSIFTVMLPSLVRSLNCGFQYLVVIGYDLGDPFYDSEKVMHLRSCDEFSILFV